MLIGIDGPVDEATPQRLRDLPGIVQVKALAFQAQDPLIENASERGCAACESVGWAGQTGNVG